MDRRFGRIVFLVFLALSALARVAAAAPNDAAAKKLRDQAVDQDFLATNYAAAEKKLTDALTLCKKTSDCSPFVRARIHCDLGVVELMLHKEDLGRTEFATALLEDPGIELDKDLSSTDAAREFAAAKGGGSSPSAPSPPPALPVAAPAAAAPQPPAGGMTHTPPTRQKVRVPLPLYVEVARDLGVSRVLVRYKRAGSNDWKTAALSRMAKGYGGEIPCSGVGSSEGELQYYVQALDQGGDLVVASGRSASPHDVSIVKKLEGPGPHLPGQPPPEACKAGSAETEPSPSTTDSGDCPPGFPGCRSEAGAASCDSPEDCVAGEACVDHVCQRGSDVQHPYKKNWLSIGVQAELLLMPGASDACLGGQGYACFQSGTSNHYDGVPTKGVDDTVLGGFATAPMVRVVVGYDRAVLANLTLGGRVGYAVVGGGPQRPGGAAFLPVNAEARLSYFLGKNPLASRGVRLYGTVSGGMMEVDASQTIDVRPTGTRTALNVDAWTKTGLGFGAAGPGAMYAFTPQSGLALELKAIALFPTFGIAFGGQLAYVVGL